MQAGGTEPKVATHGDWSMLNHPGSWWNGWGHYMCGGRALQSNYNYRLGPTMAWNEFITDPSSIQYYWWDSPDRGRMGILYTSPARIVQVG